MKAAVANAILSVSVGVVRRSSGEGIAELRERRSDLVESGWSVSVRYVTNGSAGATDSDGATEGASEGASEGAMDGASEGAATLGAAALGDPADEAHAATTSGMIRIE